ncbi:MAG: hypothetical protein AABO57_23985 [Acidobacteriota bacterium]
MEFNKTDAAIPASPTSAEATSTVAGEIDLYEELKAFEELTSAEQRRLVERLQNAAAAEEVSQSLPAEPVLTQPPMPEAADGAPARRAVESVSVYQGSNEPVAEPVLTQLPVLEAADSAPARRAVESVSVYQGSKEPVEAHLRPFEISYASGPLTEMSPLLLFIGALSRGVCLACGAESGVDDLFCITCGVFIDEVDSTQRPTQPLNPTCSDCNLRIVAGEIFCPGCGSVLPG